MADKHTNSMELVRFLALTAVGVGITVASGLAFGRFTQRWGPQPDLAAAAQKLQSFPTEVGNWRMLSEEEIPKLTLQTLSCAGYVKRQYVNRQSGQIVTIAIVVGPSGPIAVHTPEICYSSIDYSIQDARKEVTIKDKNGQQNSFWFLAFRPNKPTIDRLQVYYAWRSGDEWIASKSPRFQFAGGKLLQKLQMAALVPAKTTGSAPDPCHDFLSALLQTGWNSGS